MRWRVCVRRECSPKLEIVVRRSLGSKGASSGGTRREKSALPPLCHPATPEGRIERERAQIPDRSSVLLREPSRSVVLPLQTVYMLTSALLQIPSTNLWFTAWFPLDFGIVLLSWFEVCLRICFMPPPLSSFKCFFLVKRSFGYNDLFHLFGYHSHIDFKTILITHLLRNIDWIFFALDRPAHNNNRGGRSFFKIIFFTDFF